MKLQTYKLSDEKVFSFANGLWKGKKPPFTQVSVVRNTNFRNNGQFDYSDVAVLDVETKQFEKRKLECGDIVIERSGGGPSQPVGRVCFFDKREDGFSFSNFTSRLRVIDSKLFDPLFVHYALLNLYNTGETEKIQNRTTGIRNLDFNKYKEIALPCPTLSEQKRIAKTLSTIQEAIETQDKIIGNLRELKKVVMEKVFTKGLDGEKTKQTEIGEMPEGWKVATLKDLVIGSTGGTPSRSRRDFYNGNIPWVKSGEVNNRFIYNTEEKISEEGLKESAAKFVEPESILIAMYGATAGKVATLKIRATTNQAILAMRPADTSNLDSGFLFYVMEQESPRLLNQAQGAAQPNLNKNLIESHKIPLPPLSEQKRIAETSQSIDKKIEQHENKKVTLQDFFKVALNDLMKGENLGW